MSNFKYDIEDTFEIDGLTWTVTLLIPTAHVCFYVISNPSMPDKECAESYLNNVKYLYDNQKQEESVFLKIGRSVGEMVVEKDKAYGNAALKPKKVFAKHHIYGARLDEKLARVEHSIELRKNDVADIMGGLMLICKDKGWTDFSDLID